MRYETFKDLPPLILVALLGGFVGCNEDEKDVQPGQQQQTASGSEPQFHHDGTDSCPIEGNECQEHCGEYKIVLDESYCQDSIPVYYSWDDCDSRIGFCVKAYKEDESKAETLKNHCACCAAIGNGIEPQSGHFECAQTSFWGQTVQEKINDGVDICEEYNDPTYFIEECGEVTDEECCPNGYRVNYDHSANKVTIGCITPNSNCNS